MYGLKHLRDLYCPLIGLTILLAPRMAWAETPAMIIVSEDGSRTEYELSTVERINLGEESLSVITDSGETTPVYYSDIDRIYIDELSRVAQAVGEGKLAVWPGVTDGLLYVAGADKGTDINVYTASGAMVVSAIAGDDIVTLDLSSAPSGVCLVAVGKHTVKVIRK